MPCLSAWKRVESQTREETSRKERAQRSASQGRTLGVMPPPVQPPQPSSRRKVAGARAPERWGPWLIHLTRCPVHGTSAVTLPGVGRDRERAALQRPTGCPQEAGAEPRSPGLSAPHTLSNLTGSSK